jgi:hypothetical protein
MEMDGCQSYQAFCSANVMNVPMYCEGFVMKPTTTATLTYTNDANGLGYGSAFVIVLIAMLHQF